jgi:hypothetical protein
MPGPCLISGYLAELSAELPAPIVAKLADGLEQTYERYLGQGLSPDAAAGPAVAEFGEPQVVVAAFIGASGARRAARRLLVTGPIVGACWGVALIINHAWAWPVPDHARGPGGDLADRRGRGGQRGAHHLQRAPCGGSWPTDRTVTY